MSGTRAIQRTGRIRRLTVLAVASMIVAACGTSSGAAGSDRRSASDQPALTEDGPQSAGGPAPTLGSATLPGSATSTASATAEPTAGTGTPGDDANSANSTASSTTTSTSISTSVTASAPAASTGVPPTAGGDPLATSVDDLLQRWGARNRLLVAAQGSEWLPVPIEADDLTIGEAANGLTAFGGLPEDVVFGGTIHPGTGEVTSVLIAYNPDVAPAGPSAVFTALGMLADPGDPSFDVLFEAYQTVADGPPGESAYGRSRNRSFVVRNVPSDSGAFVHLTVSNDPDQETAVDTVSETSEAVVDLVQ